MRRFLIIGATAFMAFGGLAFTGAAQAAPISLDPLAGATQTMNPVQEIRSRRVVRRYARRPVYRGFRGYRGYGYGGSVNVLPRYSNPRRQGGSFGNGGVGDGGFRGGQQTQGITH